MLNALKTEKGRFLLRHVANCEKCYKDWLKINSTEPAHKRIARLDDAVNQNHQGSNII